MPGARRRNSLLPEDAAPRACVSITLTRQQLFDEAPMKAAHGVACCLTIACQGLQQQHNEPMSEDSLVAAYTLGRHFANHLRVPMQDSSEQRHGVPLLIAGDHPSSESVNPTSSSSTRGHGPPAGAQSVGNHGTLDHGRVLSPQSPPKGAVTDSPASIAAQGHGTPDHRPRVCPTGASPCIASIVDPTGVPTPQSPAPPAVVDTACLTPATSDGGAASCLEDSPVPLAQRPNEPVAVLVATVRTCSHSSTDSVTTQVEYPTSLE